MRIPPVVGALALTATLVPATALAGPAPDPSPKPDENVRYQRSTAKPRARTDALDQRLASAKAQQQAENQAIETARAQDFHRRHQVAREFAMVQKQIQLLVKLIQISEDDDLEKADMLFRLADLYLEQKAYHELQVGALYEPIHEAEAAETE